MLRGSERTTDGASAVSEWHRFGHGFSWVRVQVQVPGPVANPYPPVQVAGPMANPYPPVRFAGLLDVTSHQ
jgi:hypothetical protein